MRVYASYFVRRDSVIFKILPPYPQYSQRKFFYRGDNSLTKYGSLP